MPTQCFLVDNSWEAVTAGAGAMTWRTHSRAEHDHDPKPMPHLAVMTPAGLACLDCPESDPPYAYWSRVGEPPDVTVTPSLNINKEEWHGWLTNGVLTP